MARGIIYEGVDKDPKGGMNPTANIFRDAWVFELIPETEKGEGWDQGRIDDLYDKVSKAWAPYAHMPSNLPPELKERHFRIYKEAMARARGEGWDPDKELEDEA